MQCNVCHSAKTDLHTCPRCGVLYCSLHCYKSHAGAKCAAKFADELGQASLQGLKVSETDGIDFERRLVGMLAADEQSLPDSTVAIPEEGRLMELLEQLADGRLSLDSLTPEEKNEFLQQVLDSGNEKLPSWVDADGWTPWWLFERQKEPSKLIQSLDEPNDNTHLDAATMLDNLKRSGIIQHLCCTDSQRASPDVMKDVIIAIHCYVLLTRYVRGDLAVLALEEKLLQSDGADSPALAEGGRMAAGSVIFMRRLFDADKMWTRTAGAPVRDISAWRKRWSERSELRSLSDFWLNDLHKDCFNQSVLDANIILSDQRKAEECLQRILRLCKRAFLHCKSLPVDKQDEAFLSLLKMVKHRLAFWISFVHYHFDEFDNIIMSPPEL